MPRLRQHSIPSEMSEHPAVEVTGNAPLLEAELHKWREVGNDIAIQLDNMAAQKVSAMASNSRVADIQRENQLALQEMSAKLRELLG